MRLRSDKRGRLAGLGEFALGMAAEMAYVGLFFLLGIAICVACLVAYAR